MAKTRQRVTRTPVAPQPRTLEQVRAEIAQAEREQLAIEEKKHLYREQHRSFFLRWFPWQANRAYPMIHAKPTTVVCSSNKIGKSCLGANIVISWVLGFEPWRPVAPEFPGAVAFRGEWFHPSSLGIKPPVKIVITGEDWKLHIGTTIVPELKKWAPAGLYTTHKNEQGVEYLWDWFNGSQFVIMCYTQEDKLFESFRCQGLWADEPMPKPKYDALSRGLLLDHGKRLLTLTPLGEAWILDDLILSGRPDVGVVDQLCITENPDLYRRDQEILATAGLTEPQRQEFFDRLLYRDKAKNLPVEDKGKAAERYLIANALPDAVDRVLSELHLLGFIRDVEPSQVPSRVFGVFKSLVGRVLKNFKQDVHWVEPFPIPTDWPVIAMIDFHLNKPQAISFHAVNPQGVKFICHEIWEHLSPEETADAILRYVTANALRCDLVQIDPLSKGDTAYMRNRMGDDLQDSFSIIAERLDRRGITLEVASKDKDSGVRNIIKELEGVNGRPTYFVFNTCVRHLHEVNRWVYGDDGKPAKLYDDMMENWYRATLAGLVYTPMRPKVSLPLRTGTRSGHESWMGI